MRLDSLPRTLRQKASLAFILVVLLAIGNVSIVQFLLRESDGVAATLNVAGKMRMLSQRIGLEALVAHQHPDLPDPDQADLPSLFEAAHDTLRRGGHAFGLDIAPVPEVLAPQLSAVGLAWMRYRVAVDALAGAPAGDRDAVADLARTGADLLAHTEALMDGLVVQARTVQQRTLYGAYALFALDLVLLALAGWVVFRRILRPIRDLVKQCRALAAGDYAARSALPPGDELGELGRVLNDSAAHIEQLLRDIEREHAALAEAQAMFNGLSDNTVAGIYMADENLRFIHANARMAEILGYPQAELAAGLPFGRVFVGPAYEVARAQALEWLSGRAARTRYECVARRRDGDPIELEIFGSLMSLHGRPDTGDSQYRSIQSRPLRHAERRWPRGRESGQRDGLPAAKRQDGWPTGSPAMCFGVWLGYSVSTGLPSGSSSGDRVKLPEKPGNSCGRAWLS
ncbi:MAG: type IV pili methyl-accepting chemotaxis transducer N-terminal domain-containing protein, partial [Burkholderiales bacterium]|nr:type IV pili methyl-accepting chemotaxis transducer N-terminal domain-containing protein [Burkholderiales bacterium]